MSTHLLKRIVFWSMGALVWVPLVYFPLSLFPLSFPQSVVLQILVSVLMIASVWVWYREPDTRPRRSPLLLAITAFFVVQLVCAALGVDFMQSIWSDMARATGLWYQLHIFAVVVVFASPLFSGNLRTKVLRMSVWAALLVALLGIAQVWNPELLPNVSTVRIGSTLGNPVLFASYILLELGIACVLLAQDRRSWRSVVGVFIVVGLLALFFAQARGTYVGLLLGIGVGVITWLVLQRRSITRKVVGVGIGAMVLFAVLLGVIFVSSPAARTWGRGLLGLTSLTTRSINWGVAWHGFLAKPIAGWGPENYRRVSDTFYNPALSEISYVESFADKPHNQVLELLATSGVVGGLAFVIIIGCLLRTIIRARRANLWDPVMVAVLVGVGVAHVGQMVFLFENPGTYLPVGLLVAWVLAQEQTMLPLRSESSRRVPVSVVWVATGCIATAAISLSVLPFVSSCLTNYGLQLSYVQKWADARAYVHRAYGWYTPYHLEQWRWSASLATDMVFAATPEHTLVGLTPQMRSWFDEDVFWTQEKARVLLAEQPHGFLVLSMIGKMEYQIATLRNDPPGLERANTYFQQATATSPAREEGYLLQSQALLALHRPEDARRVIQEALQRAGDTALVNWYSGFPLLDNPSTVDEGLRFVARAIEKGFVFETPSQVEVVTRALVEKEQFAKLVDLYEYVVQQLPNDPMWWSRLALAYGKVGRIEDARKAAAHAVDLDPSYRAGAEQLLKEIAP